MPFEKQQHVKLANYPKFSKSSLFKLLSTILDQPTDTEISKLAGILAIIIQLLSKCKLDCRFEPLFENDMFKNFDQSLNNLSFYKHFNGNPKELKNLS